MHHFTDDMAALAEKIYAYTNERTRLDPVPLDTWETAENLAAACGPTITPGGLGGDEAFRIFADILGPACLSVDYPKYLSFVPAAPTEASVLFDLVVGASSIYGGSWIEGAGAVYAENEALRWLADLAGMPDETGGVFVPGGTVGNLSALVAARDATAAQRGSRPDRWAFVASSAAHSSVASAAKVMDADVILAPTDDSFRLTRSAVEAALDEHGDRIAGVVTTAGTTNLGVIDDLRGIGELCRERGVWMHVDAAYGGAAMVTESTRPLFDGVELADSLIIDPHKWLFAPFDCCGLLYRNPDHGRAAHAQHAGYLEFLDAHGDWNPSDFAIHLTRRTRGLPFWFSLATYGTDAYAEAIQVTLDLAADAARQVEAADHLTLSFEQSLSIVVFERDGWTAEQYQAWSVRAMQNGSAFVVPSRHEGRPVFRFCFVNPRTKPADTASIIADMR